MPSTKIDEQSILGAISRVRSSYDETFQRVRVWRALINRNHVGVSQSQTGTLLPAPFHKSSLALQTMIGQPMEAAQHYVARISGNKPDFKVVPLSDKPELKQSVDRNAAEQERLIGQLWEEAEGGEAQNTCAWAQVVGGVGYYVTLPRDMHFGLPQRNYWPDSDETREMIASGRIKASPSQRTTVGGQVYYVEDAQEWVKRRQAAAKNRPIDGTSLFTLKAYPRDMVLRERDADGIKWACIEEEINAESVKPGSALAKSAAMIDGIAPEDQDKYGLIWEKGQIIGGLAVGAPASALPNATFSLKRYFNRTHQAIFVGSTGGQGGKLVFCGEHGATVNGHNVCPVVEVPFMRTDIEVPGQEFATPLAQVMAYVPLVNQIMTLRSNGTAFNLLPRWYFKTEKGETLRGDDGEPVLRESATVPGLNPAEAAVFPPGEWKQLTIESADTDALLELYMHLIAEAMPSDAARGEGGSSEAAWHAQLMIEQSHQNLQQPVANHAWAVKQIAQMWFGWLRQLDTNVYFYPFSNNKTGQRSSRNLIEFDPANLTDSVIVTQEIHDPQASIVRIQVGMEQRAAGLIDDRKYYEEYAREKDPRQAEIDKYVQMVKDHVIGGIPAAPGSLIAFVADAVRGRVSHNLLISSPNYAIATAEQMALQATGAGQAYAQTGAAPGSPPAAAGGQPPQPQGNVADAAGVRTPGVGMAPTLQGQLGANAPGSVPVG